MTVAYLVINDGFTKSLTVKLLGGNVIWFEILIAHLKNHYLVFKEMVNLYMIGGKKLVLLATREKNFSRQLFQFLKVISKML